MTSTHEEEVVSFLRNPQTFGEPPGTAVEVIETHAARVFLCGAKALKVKRPVRLPYLDFTTCEARHKAIAREFEINRSAAPSLYLGVHRITRACAGNLTLDGPGETIDWVLAMRRFDGEALLSRLAATRGIDDRLAIALADMAHTSHASAEISMDGGAASRFAAIIADVAGTCRNSSDSHVADAGERFRQLARERHDRSGQLIEERAQEGFRRRCHGDLHLGNIVLWQGRPVPFDAIEFDEALATIDILYDLAFLLMDLDHRQLARAATIVLGRYLRLDDHRNLDALGLLPLFMGLRAGIRAMVAVERAELAELAAQEGPQTALEEARRYLRTAVRCLSPPPPRLIAIGGLSGTGKSTLAALLAPALGARPGALHLRSDVERKRLCGVADSDRLPQTAYRAEVTERVYRSLADQARRALAAGHSVIVDAVHARPDERRAIEHVAERASVPFAALWLEAPSSLMKARVEARRNDASDADASVVTRQLGYDLGPLSWPRVDAGHPPAKVLAAAVETLGLELEVEEEAVAR